MEEIPPLLLLLTCHALECDSWASLVGILLHLSISDGEGGRLKGESGRMNQGSRASILYVW